MDNQQLVDLKNILLSLQCKNETEEIDVLRKSILLNDIHFPKLHQAFSNLSEVKYTAFCANTFYAVA
ncbi:hypothetical protein [Sporomusa acidovorans]|uniref:hypothetical protein n=1 Tax=Sporomusa acidovorans TaxID=112900 RepID=UPI000B80D9DD|nr:hypothetical protein [Sporomusa acidovorans]